VPETLVIVSVDTEPDNWVPTREEETLENIRELPRFQTHCDALGVPVTYFTAYPVAATPWSAGVLRDLASGRAEVAAHLHPWDTPPIDEPFVPRNTMLCNLDIGLQRAKLASLTHAIEAAVGVRPTSFRAGRFGLGRETTQVLIEQGYRADSSVTPWVSWERMDAGPNYVGAPLGPYTLDGTTHPREAVIGGQLIEVPVSSGYLRWPFNRAHQMREVLSSGWRRSLPLAGIASRLGLARRIILSPETDSTRDMLRLARLLVAHDVPHLSVFLHSPSLRPGLSPFARTWSEVARLYRSLAELVEGLHRFMSPSFATLDAASTRLAKHLVPLQCEPSASAAT
jgi:hypothetical protein